MKYISTRGASPAVSSAQAIVNGLAPDGGLYTFSPQSSRSSIGSASLRSITITWPPR